MVTTLNLDSSDSQGSAERNADAVEQTRIFLASLSQQPGLEDDPFPDANLEICDTRASPSSTLNGVFSPAEGVQVGFDQPHQHGSSGERVLPLIQHQSFFSWALLTNASLTNIQLPWESHFARQIFDEENHHEVTPRILPFNADDSFPAIDVGGICAAETAEPVLDLTSTVFEKHIKSHTNISFDEKQEKLADMAACKLLVVIRLLGDDCAVFQHVVAEENSETGDPRSVVDAIIGTKSPLTVAKRANSLLSYFRWASKFLPNGVGSLSEEAIWSYWKHLHDTDSPATKAASCLSAFRFALHCLETDCLSKVVNSRRICGLADKMLSKKRLLHQASALTVTQMKALHRKLVDENLHPFDRALAAMLLISIYGRCRASDLSNVHRIILDCTEESGGYIELQTNHHKTGRNADKKTRLLPILVPARGVTGDVYAVKAVRALQAVGVEIPGIVDAPLLPAPDYSGDCLTKRPLQASEISAILRELIGADDQLTSDGIFEISSHSCKATMLAWSAKFGLDSSTRSLLGRHAGTLSETFAIYSRDLMVAPVRKLQEVNDDPDAARRDFFNKAPCGAPGFLDEVGEEVSAPVPPLVTDECKVEELNQVANPVERVDSSSSGSESSSGFESSASSVHDPVQSRVKRFRPKVQESENWYVHHKSHMLHKLDEKDEYFKGRFFLCGKRLSEAYSKSTESTAMNSMCKVCTKRM